MAALAVLGVALTGCSTPEKVDQGPSARYRAELSGDCAEDFIVVFVRGSSQPQDVSGQPETRRFFQAIDEVFKHDVKIGYVSVEYPAAGGFAQNVEAYRNGAKSGGYHDSREAGTKAAAEFVNERAARCDTEEKGQLRLLRQRFILGGYSQGAHALREALFRLDRDALARTSYVALFGDPTFHDSPIGAGTRAKGSEGIFGGPAQQVPAALSDVSESYCDRVDLFCSAGTHPIGMALGQSRDLMRKAWGVASEHALYPYDEMYRAAAENLKRRHLPMMRPRIDTQAGSFGGRYEGVAACKWSGKVGSSTPGLMQYLTLEVTDGGAKPSATERLDRLTAVLTYEDTAQPTRNRLGRAELTGTGSEGRIELRHGKWLDGGKGLIPLNITAKGTAVVTGDGPVAGARKLSSLATPLEGHEGCFYRLDRTAG